MCVSCVFDMCVLVCDVLFVVAWTFVCVFCNVCVSLYACVLFGTYSVMCSGLYCACLCLCVVVKCVRWLPVVV